jgi:protein phosphatase
VSFNDEDTVENIPDGKRNESVVATSIEDDGIEIAALTHAGHVRLNNEDQYGVIRRTRSGKVLASSLPDADGLAGDQQNAWLLAVADGLGGHASGEVASGTAIRTILRFASGLSTWIMRPADGQLREDVAERVELYARAIQKEMKDQAARDPGLAGMATTVTAAYIFGSTGIVVNVGDSRSYLLRQNDIQQITRDHTLAQHMRDSGATHDQTRGYSNLLTRTFSAEDKRVDVDLFHLAFQPGDCVLLCSDGLTDMLSDDAIQLITETAPSLKVACERLVLAALNNGGRDNITVVLARV